MTRTIGDVIIMEKRSVSRIMKALSYFLFPYAVGLFVVFLAHDSPARQAYGIISGWWAALFLCNYLNIGFKEFWHIVSLDVLAVAASALFSPALVTSVADMADSSLFLLAPYLLNIGLAAIKAWVLKIGTSHSSDQGEGGQSLN